MRYLWQLFYLWRNDYCTKHLTKKEIIHLPEGIAFVKICKQCEAEDFRIQELKKWIKANRCVHYTQQITARRKRKRRIGW